MVFPRCARLCGPLDRFFDLVERDVVLAVQLVFYGIADNKQTQMHHLLHRKTFPAFDRLPPVRSACSRHRRRADLRIVNREIALRRCDRLMAEQHLHGAQVVGAAVGPGGTGGSPRLSR
jgi:hypothetical protein